MISKILNSLYYTHRLWLLILGVMLGLISACTPRAQVILDGQSIFNANCNSCHTIGGGNLAGPDLKSVTDKESEQWLVNFISGPNQLITSGDQRANDLLRQYNFVVMPNMGLSKDQILAVLAYIKAESSVHVINTPATTPGVGLIAGNPENGKAIFLGQVHLTNGGPFCIGCHSIDDTGILGGGTLGPNLTEAYTKYGDVGLEGILSNLPFMTMRPLFANNTLTENERADIRAFIKASVGKPQVSKEPIIITISLAGFVAAMALSAFLWRNRLEGVRRPLIERSKNRK